MLSDIKNDLLHLLNILESCSKINYYSQSFENAEAFFNFNNQLNYNASLTLLSNIGETVIKISNELKEKYQKVEWQKIKNFRNKIVHDYPGLDTFIIYKIIKIDIPKLKINVTKILKEGLEKGIFNMDEYEISKESKFYKNIDFSEIF